MEAVSSQVTAQLLELANTLQQQAEAFESITGLGGASLPETGSVVGQCFLLTRQGGVGETKPYWWDGDNWVDINGEPYQSN